MSFEEKSKASIITGQSTLKKQPLAEQMRREPTAAESKLWYFLRAGRLNGLHFRRQQVIDGFIADFYCHSHGLVIELDGGVHQNQREYDAERDRILSERGLHILRFSNEDVESNCPAVLAAIVRSATI